ncbi:TPR-like protein [Coniochaeta hoffmannii]|uniref:TPR-like protein n=1 Tax=Coniochaeta hoffmannii TaxID=91930 RepID=A0AA38R6D0_9PEZI|nr:TPR-like protein [Coniochaeta hoffmannii]
MYREKSGDGSLWDRAIERYRDELSNSDDYATITEVNSLDDLVDYAKTLEPYLPKEKAALTSIRRLKPTLKFVDDFAAILAVSFGADTKITALVWGSIRLMLTLASSAGDTLKDVLDMLEELSLTLPRFKNYETSLALTPPLENALIDVYTEVICFYARCIHFFRAHPHALLQRDAWKDFRTDFTRTERRIKRLSSTVETEAEAIRMKHDMGKYGDVLELMESLRETNLKDDGKVDSGAICHHIPSDLSPRFWGREDALNEIEKVLEPGTRPHSLRVFTLSGIGGVGKTQIARQYVSRHRNQYPTIMWIGADNVINIGQSFRDVAKKIGLIQSEQEMQDTAAATLKVKNWLAETSHAWLFVFDNADDIAVLKHVWPANGQGAIIVTTRDANAASSISSEGYHVRPFDEKLGSEFLLHIVGLDASASANMEKASEITQALGGLPLALNQIGGFIVQRRLKLREFLPLYERNSSKIDSRKIGLSSYEHTLSTVWEMSFARLSGDSKTLLRLLPFFQPDSISESIFLEGSGSVDNEDLNFLGDEMDLGDAEEALLQAGLIDKDPETAILSIHRLIQAAVIRQQNREEKEAMLQSVVGLLSWGFPDTWSKDVGHQIGAWTKCEKCLPHVLHLLEQRDRAKLPLEDPQRYGELLLRCSWYLYEREQYEIAKRMAEAAIHNFVDQTSLAFASAVDLVGLVDLDMNKPSEAMKRFNQALEIRKQQHGPGDALVASSLNNIALAHTEMGELEEAYEAHNRAIAIRLERAMDRIGNSYSNMASLLLRMGKPNEAEEMLKCCPSLKGFTDDTFLKTGNPRFSGDMVLLSRIRLRQGRLDEAVRLATKALAFRQKLLGNRLKTCDSLYDVASLVHLQGQTATAIELLIQLSDIAGSIPGGDGQLARAQFKLSVLYQVAGREQASRTARELAEKSRKELRPELAERPFTEEEFNKLCLWMLW